MVSIQTISRVDEADVDGMGMSWIDIEIEERASWNY